MKKYPKNYLSFIKREYKALMRKAYENPLNFKIMQSFDKNGLLESVMFVETSKIDNYGYTKYMLDSKSPVYFRNKFIQSWMTPHSYVLRYCSKEYSLELKNMEFIVLARYQFLEKKIPDEKTVLRNLQPGQIFIDNTGLYRFNGVVKHNDKTYYHIKNTQTDQQIHLSTDAFKDCIVEIWNFYGDKKPLRKNTCPDVLEFDSRESFTNWVNNNYKQRDVISIKNY